MPCSACNRNEGCNGFSLKILSFLMTNAINSSGNFLNSITNLEEYKISIIIIPNPQVI
ncbi:MAG: hypothetical protein WC430_02510 [Patescibacteria group bacterium]